MNKIPSLDGLRAASIAVVFIGHSPLSARLPVPGSTGVTVFFFLSGFLITTLLRREQDLHGHVDLKAFYQRRALRIFPVLYLVLVIALLLSLSGALSGTPTLGGVISQFGHMTNYYIIASGRNGLIPSMNALWSLAVEEHFYLLFPLMFVVLSRRWPSRRTQAYVLLGLCAVVTIWRTVAVYSGHAGVDRAYLSTDMRADSLLLGCALALGYNPTVDVIHGPRWLWTWALTPVSLVAFYEGSVYSNADYSISLRYTAQGLILGVIFICAIKAYNWGPWAVLNTRPVAFLGVLSYSLYLVHRPVIGLLQEHTSLSPYPLTAAALVLSLGASYGLYRFIEIPAGRLRGKLSRTNLRGPAEEPYPTTSRPLESATLVPVKAE
jgi:peptidoglycan/LPS O-acetylase OafA/YrhL